jgi:hypothetical protein
LAATLVDPYGSHEDDAHGYLLPERLDPNDDETILKNGGNAEPNYRAGHCASATEQARAAYDDSRNNIQVGLSLSIYRRGTELRQ